MLLNYNNSLYFCGEGGGEFVLCRQFGVSGADPLISTIETIHEKIGG